MFPHLRDTTLNETMDTNDISFFIREEPPKSPEECMHLFSTKAINIPGQPQIHAELHVLQSSSRNIIDQEALKAVKPEDFQQDGKFLTSSLDAKTDYQRKFIERLISTCQTIQVSTRLYGYTFVWAGQARTL